MFSKKNLKFHKDYKWKAAKNDNPDIRNSPDSDLLNRNEGYEVLYFIQHFLKKQKLKSNQHAERVEVMLKSYFPGDIRQRDDVEKWLIRFSE